MSHESKKSRPKQPNGSKRGPSGGPMRPVPGAAREWEGEPVVRRHWMPMWLVIFTGLLFFWAQLYLDRNAAGFDARVYEPWPSYTGLDAAQPKDEAALFLARGKALYEARCQGCHQATGAGGPGIPPLAGSEWVLTPGAGRITRIVINGLQGPIEVKGQTYGSMAMPPGLVADLSDADTAALISYVRQAWGNDAPLVSAEQVESIRQNVADRSQPWTGPELLSLPVTE